MKAAGNKVREIAEVRAGVRAKIKLGRLDQDADPMGAVVFLAAPASAPMTGSTPNIDGGGTADLPIGPDDPPPCGHIAAA
ncbi:MAG: hypothetical protein R3D59_07745 [Paracoccaceae bacterium]